MQVGAQNPTLQTHPAPSLPGGARFPDIPLRSYVSYFLQMRNSIADRESEGRRTTDIVSRFSKYT